MSYQNLTTTEFKKLTQEKGAWLLDVREKDEFDAGHLPGAILVPLSDFDTAFEKLKIPKTAKILLYCRSGRRSAFAGQRLVSLDYQDVYNLLGGILAWE